jgi:cell division protein FtsQ
LIRGRKNRRRIDQAEVKAAAIGVAARALRLVGLAIVLSAVAIGATLGGREGREYLLTSRTFALAEIAFEGNRRAPEGELLGLSGVRLGDNIFETDVLSAERAMASHPWVKRVSIERLYPRRLMVRVIEHEPKAIAEMGRLYYVNEAGKVFKKLSPGEDGDFPLFTGVSREEFLAREEEASGLFREALLSLAVYREHGLDARAPVSEVRVDRVEGLTLFCGSEAVAVKLGFKDYAEKFSRLDRLFGELSRRGARAEVIRLDNRTRPGWVAVQLAEARVEGQ